MQRDLIGGGGNGSSDLGRGEAEAAGQGVEGLFVQGEAGGGGFGLPAGSALGHVGQGNGQ